MPIIEKLLTWSKIGIFCTFQEVVKVSFTVFWLYSLTFSPAPSETPLNIGKELSREHDIVAQAGKENGNQDVDSNGKEKQSRLLQFCQ
jgi:hypothetical protein